MPDSWRVVYEIQNRPDVATPIAGYPSLGVKLEYEGNSLVRLTHEFSPDETLSEDEAYGASLRGLRVLWELLEHERGEPPRLTRGSVTKLGAPPRAVIAGRAQLKGSVIVVKPVSLPSDAALAAAPERLAAWLSLSNQARQASSDVEAIRNYYMVWEDMNGVPADPGPEPELELKYTRHFVSHGAELTDRKLLRFLEQRVAPGTNQFDPHNDVHVQFVAEQRRKARALVEAELTKRL